ncbi:hypothetical protein EC973_002026 [Apophysomyces ossiformis]|uniref:F-box domain-containing protein n=1 Tax=Apophysomyces ossiformis TaxID=679940 RepID=A0A8H7BN80_9FUNG|nr:hypothetical protein EC973_002026 [Apophysomyces ossiformis]
MTFIPYEILSNIAEYLTAKDRRSCALVCQSWRNPFSRALYSNVLITTRRRLTLFLETLQHSTLSPQPRNHLGRLVRSLTLEYNSTTSKRSVGLTKDELGKLSILCPFIEALDFHPRIWRSLGNAHASKRWPLLSKLPPLDSTQIAIPLLHDLRDQLTHVKLETELIWQVKASESIFSLIVQLKCLEHLELAMNDRIWERDFQADCNLGDIESIHSSCTRLSYLDMRGLTISMSPRDHRSIDLTQLPTANNMRVLNLRDVALEEADCFMYFLRKYPNLEAFGWYDDDGYVALEALHEDPYTAFAEHYRRLKKMHVESFGAACRPSAVFFNKLREYNIQLDYFHLDMQIDLSQPDFSSMMNSLHASVSDLQLIIELVPDITPLWHYLGQCSHLANLKLINCTHSTIDISLILDHCPRLKSLSVSESFVVVHPVQTMRHGLRKIELSSVIFNASHVLACLGDHCPQLEHVSLLYCYDRSDSACPIRFYAPRHRFKSIFITQLGRYLTDKTGDVFGEDVAIISLTQLKAVSNNRNGSYGEREISPRWYYLHDATLFSDFAPIVYRLDGEKHAGERWPVIVSDEKNKKGTSKVNNPKRCPNGIGSGYIDIVCCTVDRLVVNGAKISV